MTLRFRIPTPLGNYNPDWAILVEQDGAERLYFVRHPASLSSNADSLGYVACCFGAN